MAPSPRERLRKLQVYTQPSVSVLRAVFSTAHPRNTCAQAASPRKSKEGSREPPYSPRSVSTYDDTDEANDFDPAGVFPKLYRDSMRHTFGSLVGPPALPLHL